MRKALPVRHLTAWGHVVRAAFINLFCIDAWFGTTTIQAGWDCCNKDHVELITRLIDNFRPGAPRYERRRHYREGGQKCFITWPFYYNYQAEFYKHADYLQKWCPSLMENLPISEKERLKNNSISIKRSLI